MVDIKESDKELSIIIKDKYLKIGLYPSDAFTGADELFIGAARSLSDNGQSCEFLGFNTMGEHVVLIDGIKYFTSEGVYDNSSLSYETFVIVEDAEQDFIEGFFSNRVKRILGELVDKKI